MKTKRQLLYFIPLILLVLNLLPVALYKDTVGFSGQVPVLQSLAPNHWHLQSLDISASGSVLQPGEKTPTYSPVLTNGATFRGFPFGAYFSNSASKSFSSSSSSYSASAWSWLWIAADGLLFIAVLLAVFKLNRPTRQQASIPAPSAPLAMPDQPLQMVSGADMAMPAQPQVIVPQTIQPSAPPTSAPIESIRPSTESVPESIPPPPPAQIP